MKKIYFLAILLSAAFSSNAQNFVYSTDQHINEDMTEAVSIYYIYFSTPTPEGITYKFEMVSNSMPGEWDLSLCDYTNCYIGVPSEGTMTTITLAQAQNGTKGFFSLTVNNKDIPGDGILELYVYDSKDHERGDTVSWNLSLDGAVSVHDIEQKETFKIYPNPATDVLNISGKGLYSGAIFNGLGKKVLSFKKDDYNTIDVSNLAAGVYFISCQNEHGLLSNSQLIIQ